MGSLWCGGANCKVMKVWYLVFFFLLVCIYKANAKYFANGAIVGGIAGGIVAAESSKSKGPEKIKGGPLEKSAVNGIGTYGNLAAKYSSWNSGQHWDFKDWNNWREVDGFLCRTTSDCSWIDPRLYCQDYELMFTPNAAWFGGDFASIKGECSCPDEMFWDNDDLRCRETPRFPSLSVLKFIGLTIGGLIIILIILSLKDSYYHRQPTNEPQMTSGVFILSPAVPPIWYALPVPPENVMTYVK